jgi:ABC-2 type transport system ATP-binding protein
MIGADHEVNSADTTLQVANLTFAYLRDPVLVDVSFELRRAAVGLLGPNGSGKTTLLRALLGLVPVAPGTVRVLGEDIAERARRVRGRLGWMPERGGYIPGMSGVGLVAYMGELAGMPARDAMQRAHEVLHYVGLADERYRPCESYSQGMKQRLKLATALVHDPVWLFLDEPTSGLDPRGRMALLELVQDLARNKGFGIILSTHLLSDVEAVCSEILVLRSGKLLARRSVADSARAVRRVFEVEGFGDESAFLAGLERIAEHVERKGRQILVTLDLTADGMDGAGGESGADGAKESAASDGASLAARGVRRIVEVAVATDYAPRRLRPRPVSLADEFHRIVEE